MRRPPLVPSCLQAGGGPNLLPGRNHPPVLELLLDDPDGGSNFLATVEAGESNRASEEGIGEDGNDLSRVPRQPVLRSLPIARLSVPRGRSSLARPYRPSSSSGWGPEAVSYANRAGSKKWVKTKACQPDPSSARALVARGDEHVSRPHRPRAARRGNQEPAGVQRLAGGRTAPSPRLVCRYRSRERAKIEFPKPDTFATCDSATSLLQRSRRGSYCGSWAKASSHRERRG